MLHEWRSRSCNHECNELSNFVKSSRWSSAWKPTSHQILTTIWWFRISDIRKFLIGILKFHGLGLWCFTLWCFVSLPLFLLFTRKKLFNFSIYQCIETTTYFWVTHGDYFFLSYNKHLHLWQLQWCQIKKCKCWDITAIVDDIAQLKMHL